LALLFIGLMYFFIARLNQGYMGFILIAIASGLMLYWVKELKNMVRSQDSRNRSIEQEQKDWVYDLINNNDELVFVAEIPGPESEINVKLAGQLLHIKGGQNFSRDITLDLTEAVGISDLKYRNGVLTIRIHKLRT
jgi:HSP20 family molecular chaperone IbpA